MYYEDDPENKGDVTNRAGALSPVNHRGLHQGYTNRAHTVHQNTRLKQCFKETKSKMQNNVRTFGGSPFSSDKLYR